MKDPEQRACRRHRLRVEFELSDGTGGGELLFESLDVSGCGVFLESELLLEVGEVFWLSFRLPNTDIALRTRGRVVRVARPEAPGGKQRPGMGIEFLDLGEAELAALQAYLQE